jgi:hypothetical protein
MPFAALCRGEAFERAQGRNPQVPGVAEDLGRPCVLGNSHASEVAAKSMILNFGGASTAIPNDFILVFVGATAPEESLSIARIEILG